jgi:hypothetical protein
MRAGGRRLCGLILASWLAASSADASESVSPVEALAKSKATIASHLAEPIAACVAKTDTDHPAFHGCIDWHSSVHGTWALVAYGRATKDKKYDELVRSVLTPEGIRAELEHLAQNPDFEMPYGRAWFLRLMIELNGAKQYRFLDKAGDEVARSILANYRSRGLSPHARDYASASWAMMNVIDYARAKKLPDIEREAVEMVRAAFLEKPSCEPRMETGFMAVCTNWAALVSRVLPREAFVTWLQGADLNLASATPITDPESAHQSGLNFSRAWGFWDIYAATGDAAYAAQYARHFEQTFNEEDQWKGDYQRVGHWVAQFGVFALQPQFGARDGR